MQLCCLNEGIFESPVCLEQPANDAYQDVLAYTNDYQSSV